MRIPFLGALLVSLVAWPGAAQIPGVPPPTPPGVERSFELFFGNDFLGRGGAVDDFRTQRYGVIAALGSRWSLNADLSILTLEQPSEGDPGREDQLSPSLGYRLVRTGTPGHGLDVEVGAGLRYYANLGGARMQNGFHKLVGSRLNTVPYISADRTVGTAWIQAPLRGRLAHAGAWGFDYWVQASTLLTTAGEWDGTGALSAVATLGWFQTWLGVQTDWREGYDATNVSRETADFESGTRALLGFRFGPFIIETAQQFSGDGNHGQARFISTGDPLRRLGPDHTLGLQAGLSIPDVYATLQARWSNCALLGCSERWRRTVVADYRFGSPQYGEDVNTYVPTWQASAQFELEHAPFSGAAWMTGYGALGLGWRSEHLEGEGDTTGTTSEAVGRAGLTADLGLRFSTSASSQTTMMLLHIGLSGWLPSSGAEVEFGGRTESLQRPQLVLVSGVVLRVFPGTG